jgi:hypothetical protein
MANRFGTWWRLWLALMLVWTAVAAAVAWINLPRANSLSLEPHEVAQMSAAAAAILPVNDPATAVPVRARRDPLVWSPVARVVRMINGVEMNLPGNTTGEQAARVAAEYRQILRAHAVAQRWQFLPGMLLLWLLPIGGIFIGVRAYQRHFHQPRISTLRLLEPYVRQRTVFLNGSADNAFNGGAEAIKVPVRRQPREIEWACAV